MSISASAGMLFCIGGKVLVNVYNLDVKKC